MNLLLPGSDQNQSTLVQALWLQNHTMKPKKWDVRRQSWSPINTRIPTQTMLPSPTVGASTCVCKSQNRRIVQNDKILTPQLSYHHGWVARTELDEDIAITIYPIFAVQYKIEIRKIQPFGPAKSPVSVRSSHSEQINEMVHDWKQRTIKRLQLSESVWLWGGRNESSKQNRCAHTRKPSRLISIRNVWKTYKPYLHFLFLSNVHNWEFVRTVSICFTIRYK